jgi:hypothetical protein
MRAPEVWLQDQSVLLGSLVTEEKTGGKLSVTTGASASFQPREATEAATVYSTVLDKARYPDLLAVNEMPRVGVEAMTASSVTLTLPGEASADDRAPVTAAAPVAAVLTVTGMEIGPKGVPTAMGPPVQSQVTVWEELVQDQLVPEAGPRLSSLGKVAVKVGGSASAAPSDETSAVAV